MWWPVSGISTVTPVGSETPGGNCVFSLELMLRSKLLEPPFAFFFFPPFLLIPSFPSFKSTNQRRQILAPGRPWDFTRSTQSGKLLWLRVLLKPKSSSALASRVRLVGCLCCLPQRLVPWQPGFQRGLFLRFAGMILWKAALGPSAQLIAVGEGSRTVPPWVPTGNVYTALCEEHSRTPTSRRSECVGWVNTWAALARQPISFFFFTINDDINVHGAFVESLADGQGRLRPDLRAGLARIYLFPFEDVQSCVFAKGMAESTFC